MRLGASTRRFNYILLLIIFVFQVLDNYFREKMVDISYMSAIKNSVLIVATLLFIIEIVYLERSNKFSRTFFSEMLNIVYLTICFTVLSLYYILKNNGFEIATVTGLVRILVPVIVSYTVLNVFQDKDLYRLMSVLLIITVIGYVLSIFDKISIGNFMKISFIDSRSPFESTYFSPTAMGFCLFFCYYRKDKIFTVLSVLFAIMTFKRIMVIYSVLLLVFGGIVSKWRKVPKWVENMFMIVFFIFSMFYILLMEGKIDDFLISIIGKDVTSFTMGRSYFMGNIITDFKSVGFMSSTVGYRSMEMDIPMIYVEMGVGAVIATIYFYTRLVNQNWYNFLIIIFCLLELLTSHWFDITYFWIVAYITIGCIAKENENISDREKGKNNVYLKKIKFKWGNA